MAVYDTEQHHRLPGGEHVVLRELVPDDARSTQQVLAAAWDATYVRPGWLSLEHRRAIVDPGSQRHIEYMAQTIEGSRASARAATVGGRLLVGAFAVRPSGRQRQVGVAQYSGAAASNRPGVLEGRLDEIDVHPIFTRRGAGRLLAGFALRHGYEVGHRKFSLDVIVGNDRAMVFYVKHMAMVPRGDPFEDDDLTGNMSRQTMVGNVTVALRRLGVHGLWRPAQS